MLRYFFVLLAALAVSVPLQADEQADMQALRAQLAQLMPGQALDSIEPAPIKGLYQAAFGSRLFYVSADGRYLISGDMFDMQEDANLTETWRGEKRQGDLEKVADSMIVYPAKGTPRHVLTIFTDIDCTYCRKLHHGIKEMNDLGITVRYLGFPRAGNPSQSYDKLAAVWCADDQHKAMDLAKNEQKVKGKACASNPIAEHLALGMSFGINATPTMVLEDGVVVPGYLPPDKLIKELDRMQQAKR